MASSLCWDGHGWRSTCTSTRTSCRRAWPAGCACRTARRSGSTGEEALSPRGRIDAMRAVQWRGADADDEFVRFMETCVQCRGCEPACPSGVPFGHLMEGTRNALGRRAPHRAAVAAGRRSPCSAATGRCSPGRRCWPSAQRLRLVPRRAGLARLPLRRGPAVRPTGDDVWLFTGCVMDAWMRDTHRVDGGADRARPARRSPCPTRSVRAAARCTCTPGSATTARRLAERTMRSMPGDGADPRQLGRLRRGDEGLRPPARHGRGGGVRGPGARRARVAGRRASTGCRRRRAGSAR